MKNLFAAFFCILLTPFLSTAQNNYKPGYVVTLKGDTLHGFINCKTGSRNPTGFTFKSSLNNGAEKRHGVADTRAFVISGYQVYKRFILNMSQDVPGANSNYTPLNTKPVSDTVFLNLIDSGKNVTLYQYTDKIKERFFIAEKNTQPAELIMRIYPDPNHATEVLRQETYKRQLQRLAVKYLPQYQAVEEEAQDAAYTKEDIEKIVFEINGADKATMFTSDRPNKVRPFIGIGLSGLAVSNFTTYTYLGPATGSFSNVTTQQAVSAEINLGEDIFLSQKQRSMIFRVELHAMFSGNSTITDNNSGNLLEQYHATAISLNPQLLFNIIDSDGTQLYLGAGGQLFILGGVSSNNIQSNYDELNPPAYYAWNFTFTTRADFVFNNKIDLYVGYSPPAKLEQNTVSSFHVGLMYLFGVK